MPKINDEKMDCAYTVRMPSRVRDKLAALARRHGMRTPEYVRTVLWQVADENLTLTIKLQENVINGQIQPAA